MAIIAKIKNRLGDLWWYTLVLFVMQRMGDFINVFIGLWLVPKYVPAGELGSVLPLTAVGGVLGLPISILMIPFMKFLNIYMTRGEYGKVKMLLRDVFVLMGFLGLIIFVLARVLMPLVFVRMRIVEGRLGLLVVATGVFVAVTPVLPAALQAAKHFQTLSLLGFGGSILRFVTLLLVLPMRGLSGYFLGQLVPAVAGAVATFVILWRRFLMGVKTESYWHDDSGRILRYTVWVAMSLMAGSLTVFTENFVIRHRLPDLDSAGYYMVSRFSEIAFSIGSTVAMVLFPLVSELKEGTSEKSLVGLRLAQQSMAVSFAIGVGFVLLLWCSDCVFLDWVLAWRPYKPFKNVLMVLAAIYVLRGVVCCFMNYCFAENKFRFVLPFSIVGVLEFLILYCGTGYEFFAPVLGSGVLEALRQFNPCRLEFILAVMGISTFCLFVYSLFAVCSQRRPKGI